MRILACLAVLHLAGAGEVAAHTIGPQPDAGSDLVWTLDPGVTLPLGLAAGLYLVGVSRLRRRTKAGVKRLRRQAVLFASGWLISALALISPLDTLGSRLFAVHMVQHEVLILVAAPLLVAAAPGAVFVWAFGPSWRQATAKALLASRRFWRALAQPLPAWWLHAVVLWVWHLPSLFDRALQDEAVHALQHLSFVLAAVVFWHSLWHRAANPAVTILSLFTTALHASLLGALLTFAPSVWYESYLDSAGSWGLTPLEDQQLGGLIMWMPGGIVYLFAALCILAQWLNDGKRSVGARRSLT